MRLDYFNKMIWCQFVGVFALSFLIHSCKSDFEKAYDSLNNSKIVIPSNMSVTCEGKDTIINNIWKSEFKLVVYKDSMSCTPCFIETLPQWENILNKYDSKKLSILFILSPTKTKENDLRLLLQFSDFKYPVILDFEKSFRSANLQIPENKLFHTFLLDKNNKVVLVGDPLNNIEINNLFKKRLK